MLLRLYVHALVTVVVTRCAAHDDGGQRVAVQEQGPRDDERGGFARHHPPVERRRGSYSGQFFLVFSPSLFPVTFRQGFHTRLCPARGRGKENGVLAI